MATSPCIVALWAIRDGAGVFSVGSAPVVDGNHYRAGFLAAEAAHANVAAKCSAADLPTSTRWSAGFADDGGGPSSEAAVSAPQPPQTPQTPTKAKTGAAKRRHDMLMWLYTAPGAGLIGTQGALDARWRTTRQ